jgi:hypothetical protein
MFYVTKFLPSKNNTLICDKAFSIKDAVWLAIHWDSEWKFCEAYTNHGGEAGDLSSAFGHTSDVIWTVMCLRKFVDLYNNYYNV